MFQSNKAQTSIEFIILVAILLLIGFYFIGSIYKTFDSTYAVYTVKNRTLQLLSENDSEYVLSKINYQINDSNINLTLYLIDSNSNNFDLNESYYANDITDIQGRTSFDNIGITFRYI